MPETTSEPTTPKRKTARKSRRRKASKDDIDEKIKAAKNEALRKAELEANSDFMDEEPATPQEDTMMNFEEYEDTEGTTLMGEAYHEEPSGEHLAQANADDIFDDIEENHVKHGTPVIFRVKRNGQFIGEHDYPLSWVEIQKTYKGGNYTVEARHATTKRYIRSQTQLVYAPQKEEKEDRSERERIVMPPPQAPQVDPNEMVKGLMGAFQEMQKMTWEEKKSKERDERKSDNQFNSTFLTLMQNQQQNTQSMFLEMQKNTQDMMKSISENFTKSQERMDDKFSKIFDRMQNSSNKKDEFSLKDMLMLQQQAEDRGWDRMKLLIDLSEAKAEEKASHDDGGGSDNMLSTLVKGLMPILGAAGQQQQLALQQAQQQHRRPLPQGPRNQPSTTSSQGAPSRPTQNPTAKQNEPAQSGVQKSFAENSLGLPTLSDMDFAESETVTEPVPTLEREVNAQKPEGEVIDVTPEQPKSIEQIFAEASPTQQQIANITVPIIAELILNTAVQPGQVAGLCLDECAKAGFDRATVLREFTFDFMLQIAGAFGLGEDQRPWFEEFYANIQNETGMDAEGEDQPTLG